MKNRISRAFSNAAKWQITVTAAISAISLLISGIDAAMSASLGGASVIAGAFAGVVLAGGKTAGTPGEILVSLLKAEGLKILVTAMLLWVIFKSYQGLVPLALIGGLAGSALAAGAGLKTVGNENNE